MLGKQLIQAAAGAAGAGGAGLYVDDVFSTYLYDGSASAQTFTNGIDLSGEGGLVWVKRRDGSTSHALTDTARGVDSMLCSDQTATPFSGGLSSFNSNGFTVQAHGDDANNVFVNKAGNTYASWSFRKAPGWCDVVTYSGSSSAQSIAHNLGSKPGFIIVKCTNDSSNWRSYHRSLGATKYFGINSTNAAGTATSVWNDTEPTTTHFTVGTSTTVNGSGRNFVAYIFAHDDAIVWHG